LRGHGRRALSAAQSRAASPAPASVATGLGEPESGVTAGWFGAGVSSPPTGLGETGLGAGAAGSTGGTTGSPSGGSGCARGSPGPSMPEPSPSVCPGKLGVVGAPAEPGLFPGNAGA